MGWLVCDGRVLASVDIADTGKARRKGYLGRSVDDVDGGLVLPGVRWVHTIGMRFPLDVAYLGPDGTVLRITHMARNRVGRPERHARSVVEAPAGSFERWGLSLGMRVELRP